MCQTSAKIHTDSFSQLCPSLERLRSGPLSLYVRVHTRGEIKTVADKFCGVICSVFDSFWMSLLSFVISSVTCWFRLDEYALFTLIFTSF